MLGLLSKLVRKRTDGRRRLANLFVAANGGGGHDEKERPRPEGDVPAGASWQSRSK